MLNLCYTMLNLCCTNTCTQVAGCMLNLCYTNLSKFASATAISLTGIPPSGCYRMERYGLAAHCWRVAPLPTCCTSCNLCTHAPTAPTASLIFFHLDLPPPLASTALL